MYVQCKERQHNASAHKRIWQVHCAQYATVPMHIQVYVCMCLVEKETTALCMHRLLACVLQHYLWMHVYIRVY